MKGNEYALDWGTLVPHVVHPTKVQVIEAMRWINRPLSATQLEGVLGRDLSAISYHLGSLKKWGVVKQTRWRRVRGSVERFYFFS